MQNIDAYFNPNKKKPVAVVEPTTTADANGDGKVDGLDYLVWATNYGKQVTGGPAEGDFNNDGVVDGLDYLVWINSKDEGVADLPPDPTIVPDPEPEPEPILVPVVDAPLVTSRLDGWDLNTQGVPLPADETEYAQILSMFPPLQKQHYSWPWSRQLHENPDLALQVARISGSVGCSCRWDDTQAEVDRAVGVARDAGVGICIQYSPYHEHYAQSDARDWGEGFRAAIADAQMVAERFKTLFDQAKINMAAPSVEIIWCEFDQELLRSDINDETGKPDPYGIGQQLDQLSAVAAKNDIIWRIFKEVYPDVEILWHGFTGHGNYHSQDQMHDGWGNTELYQNQGGPALLKEKVTAFVNDCEAYGLGKFCPAVSVGGFYDVSVALPHPGYVRDKPYPVKFSWHKGRDLNHPYFSQERFEHRFGPTWKIEKFYWWPAPFAPAHIGYGEHFIAYLAGAHNIKKSENDWLDTEER